MNIEEVLRELDSLPGGEETYKTGDYLREKIREASDEGDYNAELTLLSEMIGYLRYTEGFEELPVYCERAVALCEEKGLKDTLPYATTLLNIATAYRAAGRLSEALELYKEVESLYGRLVSEDDYLYAALYNNMSLLYQQLDDLPRSADCLNMALKVIEQIEGKEIQQAITRTNLAQVYIRLEEYDEAQEQLNEAVGIFEAAGGDEWHYPGCLNTLADLFFIKKDYSASVDHYRKALKLLKRHVGEDNPSYIMVNESLQEAERMLVDSGGSEITEQTDEDRANGTDGKRNNGNPDNGSLGKKEDNNEERDDAEHPGYIRGLELSRRFYEEYGKAMIHEKFPEYENRITVGLVGRGSQCYGFDDELSTDHDFGPDFCIFLDDDLFEEIGDRLQAEYNSLPDGYMGYKRVTMLPPDGRRVGVIRTKEFYSRVLETEEALIDEYVSEDTDDPVELVRRQFRFFAKVKEENLSECTNGEVFNDAESDFVRIRNKLSYYPDIIWKRKIAEELHYSAQMGQYNYIRMLKRGEKVGSELALAGYMEHTMKLVYLLNRKYAPYYKWLHHGMKQLERAAVVMDIFNAVYDMPKGDERIRMTIEIVAAIIIEELQKIGMAENVPEDEKYLDVYSRVIFSS